jgi:hypothetical protein
MNKEKTMVAFHGKEDIKTKYVERVRKHQELDEIIQGKYWEDGKGCAVGCTIQGSDHMRYEVELGIPQDIAYLEDVIFEGLSNAAAKEFPLRFLQAIKTGADLSIVIAKFMVWQFEDDKLGLKNIEEVKADKEVYGFCEEVVALYKRVIAGDKPTKNEFHKRYLKINRARTWARTWAGTWAGAGTGAGANGEALYWEAMADKLIELLEEAPVGSK